MVDGGYIQNGIYYFYQTDHLGNNRMVVNQMDSVIQQTHYYPFGLSFAESTNSEAQPYKYNGKELDQLHGLNLYDYMARHMESSLGRFTTIDPLAEKYYHLSPYVYVANNPLKFIDKDGKAYDYPPGMFGFESPESSGRQYIRMKFKTCKFTQRNLQH